ncbi:MAG: type II toxin-antitoxin system VapC family toxin [Fimbriimonadales bacterium]|nr:type II toxin-antitoxin system VapC family toxin [Fimbriimonadales bacterium]
MRHYLLDTNHFSAFWRGDPRILDRIATEPDADLGLSAPGIGEQWYMVFNSTQVARNQARMELILRQFTLWDYDQRAAQEYGRIRTELRRMGRPIPTIDMQIAAIARANSLILLTSDSHFTYVANLQYEDWLAPEE